MKLSTKGRYGLKAMYVLGMEGVNNALNLSQLSKKTEVKQAYLEKLLGMLKKAELIDTIRGASGGYKIIKQPKDITIGEILRSLEDDFYFADCNKGVCNNPKCPSKDIFNALYCRINAVLDDFTLEDMLKGVN